MECNDRVRGGDGELRQKQGQSRQLEVVGGGGLRQRWRYSLRFETVAVFSLRERWS